MAEWTKHIPLHNHDVSAGAMVANILALDCAPKLRSVGHVKKVDSVPKVPRRN